MNYFLSFLFMATFVYYSAAKSSENLPANTTSLEDKLADIMQAYVDVYDFSGSVSIQQGEQINYKQHFGLANRSFGINNSDSTIYSINSISKLFTTVMVLRLQQQGVLDLKQPIAYYWPEFTAPWASQVTLHHLLSHQSGLPRESGVASHQALSLQQQAELLQTQTLLFTPGAAYEYSNAGITLLGAIVEEISQQSYQNLIHKQIIEPLQLKHTGVYQGNVVVENQAVPYKLTARGVVSQQRSKHLGDNAGGNIYSNTEGLRQFIQAIFTEKLIDAHSLKLMTTNLNPKGSDPHAYGFSIQNFGADTLFMAAGSGYGNKSVVVYEPKKQLFIAITSNWGNTPLFDILRNLFLTTSGQSVELPDKSQFAKPQTFKAYLGEYQFDPDLISKHLQVNQSVFTLHQHQNKLYLNDDLLVNKNKGQLGFIYTDELIIKFDDKANMVININGNQLIGQNL